ncbi:hypothetical protein EXIGLDRAFT_763196 [Exidia glandulosa HHB12029]|uniref:Uncharacterized protein n=1 Tax=Exidia glandulosa HHB12029 TaxID=1314781 RepID=A0A165M3N6_EXIGL|nr:hypothetical protein EXIGLDRAFT_763196 [Exidia glandulosa HHB12029]
MDFQSASCALVNPTRFPYPSQIGTLTRVQNESTNAIDSRVPTTARSLDDGSVPDLNKKNRAFRVCPRSQDLNRQEARTPRLKATVVQHSRPPGGAYHDIQNRLPDFFCQRVQGVPGSRSTMSEYNGAASGIIYGCELRLDDESQDCADALPLDVERCTNRAELRSHTKTSREHMASLSDSSSLKLSVPTLGSRSRSLSHASAEAGSRLGQLTRSRTAPTIKAQLKHHNHRRAFTSRGAD